MNQNGMKVGLVYDIFAEYIWVEDDPPDADAEFEPIETVEALEKALQLLNHIPIRIGSPFNLLNAADDLGVDAAINISEGGSGRNREAYAPVLLEMLGIPCIGSDALTLSVTLDKAWTKDLVMASGVSSPSYRVFRSAEEVNGKNLPGPFPLFVKPRYEGSSKSIIDASKVYTVSQLSEQVDRICSIYKQDALVERFIEGGGEFTVAVIGHAPPQALPALQRAVEKETRIGLHALDRRGYENPDLHYELEGELTETLESELHRMSVEVFQILECLDFARLDFRVDHNRKPWFLEINPLPTFAPDGTFAIQAELMGVPYVEFLADTIQMGFERLGFYE